MKVQFLSSLKDLPSVFWLLCVATSLFYTSSHIFTTMLPIHLDDLHVKSSETGALLASFLVISILVRPLVGKLYDEWHPKKLFLIGLSFFALGSILMLFLPNTLWALWVARGLHGIGFSFFNGVSYSYLTETVPSRIRARGIALFSNAIKLAMAYAPALGWMLAQEGLCYESIWISLGILALTFIAVFKMAEHHAPLVEEKKLANLIESPIVAPLPVQGRWFNLKGLTPGLLIATNSFVFGTLIPFVPLIVNAKGLGHVETFHIFYALSLIASRFIGGEASDKYGRFYTIIPGMSVVVLSLFGMFLANSSVLFLASAILYGLGAGVVQPSIVAMVADRTHKGERGSAMATYTMLADSGQALGMFAMGLMGQYFSYNDGLAVTTGIAILGVAFAVFLAIKEKVRKYIPVV